MFNILTRFILITIMLASISMAEELNKVSLQLQWKYQFQFAGFIVAKERGYYKNVGLDVDILEYKNTNSMQDLEDGKVDFAINNSIIVYENKKLKNVSLIATYFQRSPLILITQPEIKTVLDLKGKTIAMSEHDLYSSSLSILLKYFSINLENTHFVKPTFSLSDFIAKKVDAATAFRSNELFKLDTQHIPYNVIDPVEYGFSTNAINLFTSQAKIKDNPQQIEAFLKATKEGWKYALSHLDEVAQLIHDKYRPDLSLANLKYEARETKKLMLLDIYDIGEVNEEFVNKIFKQLQKRGQLDQFQTTKGLIYNYTDTQKPVKVKFSKEEKEWMHKNPIVKYSEVNWKPLSIIENSQMRGIMGDYLSLVSQRSGLEFKYVKSDSWPDVLEKFKQNEIDLVPGVGSSDQEFELGSLSDVYSRYPMVIVTGKEYNYIDSLDKFQGKTIAVPKYYTSYYFIKENFPNIKILTTSSIEKALLLVASGEADAFVGHIATSLHYMTLLNLSGLKVSGTTSFEFEHRYLVHKNNPILLSIINKVFKSLNSYDREKINSKWVHTKVEKSVDLTLLYWGFAVVILAVLLILIRQRFLSKYNQELTQLKERMELALSSSNSGIWDWDIKNNRVYLSPQWKEMLGYHEHELDDVFETWKSKVHPDDIATVMQIIEDNIKERVVYKEMTYRLLKKDQSAIWVLSKAMTEYDENDKPSRVIGTHINITKSKAEELQRLQQKQIIEQIHDSVIATDLHGVITSFNHGSTLLLGYTKEEMIGESITKIYLEEDYEDLEKNLEILKANEEHHSVVKLVKKSKDIIYVDLSLSLLRDENGEMMGLVGYSQDITKRREAELELLKQKEILNYQAHHDALTGLPNRALFAERLEQAISKSKRQDLKTALLFIDLDHFKEINDSLGHAVGDKILQSVSSRLKSAIRTEDILARLGGDEFTIILEGLKESEEASVLAQKIIHILAKPVKIDENTLYVSSSIGISLYPDDGTNTQDLLKYSDAAMYKAKEKGRNNFQFYSSEMTQQAFQKVNMEAKIREALLNKDFVVYYQAQVDGETDRVTGMEALVRLQSGDTLIPPVDFIPIAEATGLIVDIDREVMKVAMSQVKNWKEEGLNPGVLSLNLTIKHLYRDDFLRVLKSTMQECGFSAEDLELEVVEGEIMSNPSEAIKILNKLRDMGIALAIDDFGTGYSSLAYLKKLPIKKLKIDQSFVKDLPNDEEDIAISRAVIALAKSMNLNIIAEGVETKEQRDFLVLNKCKNIQGYYYSKPVSAQEMKKILLHGFFK